MLLNLTDGQLFATGVAECSYRLATSNDRYHRLMVAVEVGDITVEAVIDTGAAYFICAPQVARQLALDPAESLPERISIRGTVVPGRLHRLGLTLVATDDGHSLNFDVTAFIPDPDEQSWNL